MQNQTAIVTKAMREVSYLAWQPYNDKIARGRRLKFECVVKDLFNKSKDKIRNDRNKVMKKLEKLLKERLSVAFVIEPYCNAGIVVRIFTADGEEVKVPSCCPNCGHKL